MITARVFVASTLLALCLAPAWADGSDRAERIAELRAMSASERKAAIQAMTPDERRGIWFAVKQADLEERGSSRQSVEPGFYRNAVADMSGAESAADPVAFGNSRAVGTITYDDGVITNSFSGGAIIGNRFDTHDNGIQLTASGTVSTIAAVVVQGAANTTDSAGFVLEGPQTTGGGAMAIFSTFTAGLTSTTETVVFSGIGASYTGSSFFVLFGDFASGYVPAFGTGTTASQGHHGVVGYTGGMGPNITSTFDFGGTLNALVRATGNILPVELIEYGVE